MSGRQMCEVIDRHWRTHHEEWHERFPTAASIWAYSPTGELARVFEWYDEAVEHEAPAIARAEGFR